MKYRIKNWNTTSWVPKQLADDHKVIQTKTYQSLCLFIRINDKMRPGGNDEGRIVDELQSDEPFLITEEKHRWLLP